MEKTRIAITTRLPTDVQPLLGIVALIKILAPHASDVVFVENVDTRASGKGFIIECHRDTADLICSELINHYEALGHSIETTEISVQGQFKCNIDHLHVEYAEMHGKPIRLDIHNLIVYFYDERLNTALNQSRENVSYHSYTALQEIHANACGKIEHRVRELNTLTARMDGILQLNGAYDLREILQIIIPEIGIKNPRRLEQLRSLTGRKTH